MQALRWDRAGAFPLIRVGLEHSDLDPAWQQLWRVTKLFTHQCGHNHTLREWWRSYCHNLQDVHTFGPLGKVQDEFNKTGLTLDEDGKIWYANHGCLDLFSSPEAFVRRVLLRQFQNSRAGQARRRTGLEGL